MDAHDPHTPRNTEPDDDAELRAALDELHRHARPVEELDPETEALKQRPAFQAAIEDRRRIAESEDPPAPEPVEIAAEGGAVLVQADAAATYVPSVEVAQAAPEPKAPSAPVKLRQDVDPRRLPTMRVTTRAASEAPAGAGSGIPANPRSGDAPGAAIEDVPLAAHEKGAREESPAAAREAAPEPSARRRGGLGLKRGIAVGTAIVFVAGAISMLAALRPPSRTPDVAASTTAPAAVASPPPAAVAASAPRMEASGPSMAAAAAATATITETAGTPAAPSIDAAAPSVKGAPSVRGAPSVMLTPRASGGPSAGAAAPAVTAAPSVAPVTTAAPAASPMTPPPGSTSAAPQPPSVPTAAPKPTGDDEFYIRTNKKEGAKP